LLIIGDYYIALTQAIKGLTAIIKKSIISDIVNHDASERRVKLQHFKTSLFNHKI